MATSLRIIFISREHTAETMLRNSQQAETVQDLYAPLNVKLGTGAHKKKHSQPSVYTIQNFA